MKLVDEEEKMMSPQISKPKSNEIARRGIHFKTKEYLIQQLNQQL